MAVSTRSMLQIIHAVADDLGLRTTGTLTAASASALTAASYPYKTNRTNADSNLYEGAEVYITSGTEPSPNPNGVSAYDPSTGVFTPSVNYTTAPDNDASFDLFLRDVSSTEIRAAVNEALRKRYYKVRWPVTIAADGDMSSTNTGDWTASSATLSKVSSAANQVVGGISLRVLATGVGGYARTESINVNPDALPQYYVEAAVRADPGTARLIAYDVTNSATIASEDYDLKGWGLIGFHFDLPATCEQLQIRLMSVEDTDDTYWNYLMLLPMGVSSIALPDWVDREGQVQMVYRGPAAEPEVPGMSMTRPVMWFKMTSYPSDNTMYRLEFSPRSTGSMWATVYKKYETLSSDTATTTAPRDWIETAAAAELLSRLTRRPPSSNTDEWKRQYMMTLPKLKRLDVTHMPRTLIAQMPHPY